MHSVLPFLCFTCFLLPYVVSLPQNIYVDKRCNIDNSTRNITTTFQINRNQAFLSLSTQAAIKAGFSKNTTGISPDQVSALFLCRGDYDDVNVCSSCLADASKSMQECMDLQGIIWYDQCFLHYSNQQILDLYRNSDMHFHSNVQAASGWNSSNVTATSYITSLLTDLLNNISYLAAYKSNPGKLFFTGRINVTDNSDQIFGLSQCTPDMPGDACHECLKNLTIHMLNVFNGSAGVQLLGDRCQLRYETYNFFQGNPLWTSGTIKKGHESKIVIIASSIAVAFLLAGCSLFFVCIRKRKSREIKDIGPGHQELTTTEDSSPELSHFSFSEIESATNNFNLKLGEGGFGPVYKGTLPGGLEIAVKRLAVHSGQGLLEFRNEIKLIAKIQHINLVRLVGWCIQGQEKILIYEFMPNISLDFFIFDKLRGSMLNWEKRFKIIEGIAQGLLYLHKHSRLRIIHRDMKASNILLDSEMIPKISDFGLARIFGPKELEANTNRVVGTFGYIAPEYAYKGHFSIKSDVFSFGVLLLEIVSGKRNSRFQQFEDFHNLLGYSWDRWKDGKWFELIDPSLTETCRRQTERCVHVALLCVQENPVDRPNMSDVVAFLSMESIVLPEPKQPAYFNVRIEENDLLISNNDVTLTDQEGR